MKRPGPPPTPQQVAELRGLLDAMTPAQRAAFDTVDRAVAVGVLSRRALPATFELARVGGPAWERHVAALRLRLKMVGK